MLTILEIPVYPLYKVFLLGSCQLFELYCWELPTMNQTMNSRLLVAQRLDGEQRFVSSSSGEG